MINRTTCFMSAICFMVFFTACSKEPSIQNDGIAGKWRLVKQYEGYVNGGTFTWQTIGVDDSNTLTFLQNGEYRKKANAGGNFQECAGTYTLQSSALEINSNCNSSFEKLLITELTTTSLILDEPVIEGKIRYQYTATK